MYCTAPLSPRKGRLRSFHDDDGDDDDDILGRGWAELHLAALTQFNLLQ